MSDVLDVRDLSVTFNIPGGAVQAVDNMSFRVRANSTLALVGESGSGKTAISQAILGILPESAQVDGEVLFCGADGRRQDLCAIPSRHLRRVRRRGISIVFQEPMTSLSPLHRLGDQIGEGLRGTTRRRAVRGEVLEILDRVGFPDPVRAHECYPFELSGGLRQRAMIAMALVRRPALLIADEPTTALDVTIQAQILKLMADLQKDFGMAILLITHDLGVVANIADDVVVMYHGRMLETGGREDIFLRPTHPYLRALMGAVPRMGMEEGERLRPLREVHAKTAAYSADERFNDPSPPPRPMPALASVSEASHPPSDQRPASGSVLLEVNGVEKHFATRGGLFTGAQPRVTAVNDVSLKVEQGECLGLVGESGCGKTTLSRIIMRAITPDAGHVRLHRRGAWADVHALTGADLARYRRQVQMIFQDPFSSLNPRMTVFDILREPLVIHRLGNTAARAERAVELMELVGLDPRHLRRYPHSFSGGQRQRIGIARALAIRPDVLICDEPVSALDVSVQAQVLNLLKDLKRDLGLTCLFISHNLAVVDYIADRIAVMCRGHLVEVAPRKALFSQPVHPYTRALLGAVPQVDLNHPLDLAALMEGRASDPAAWPDPFCGDSLPMTSLGNGHLVRAARVP